MQLVSSGIHFAFLPIYILKDKERTGSLPFRSRMSPNLPMLLATGYLTWVCVSVHEEDGSCIAIER